MSPIFTRDIQRALLWNLRMLPFGLPLRVCHPLWSAIPGDFEFTDEEVTESKHHTSPVSQRGIWFALHRFPSPVLTASQLLSFPADTEMFHFSAFPIPKGIATGLPMARGPIRQSPDQRLHAPTRSISLLGTTFLGA